MNTCMTPILSVAAIAFCTHFFSTYAEAADQRLIDAPVPPPKAACKIWPSQPPPGCPFKPSDSLRGIGFTGRHAEYTGADTWYPSWASDGNLYSPWTDGNVNGLGSNSAGK